jgi:arylsulfatase A-like enzyme
MLRGYYAHMAALDDCLDRLLGALDRARIAEDTIVVFTSDHGDMMLSHGLTTKQYPWEESLRVPFLLRYPRKLGTKGRRIRTPLNTPDIFPTLLGLAGIRVPDSVEGLDLSGVAAGKAPQGGDRGTLLCLPVPFTETRRHGFAEYRGLRTERYTYVRSIHGPWLLYDNQADPFQKRNLIGKPEAKELQARLDRELNEELKRRKDEFLPAAEYIKRAGVGHYRELNVKIGRHPSPWGDWDSTLRP